MNNRSADHLRVRAITPREDPLGDFHDMCQIGAPVRSLLVGVDLGCELRGLRHDLPLRAVEALVHLLEESAAEGAAVRIRRLTLHALAT